MVEGEDNIITKDGQEATSPGLLFLCKVKLKYERNRDGLEEPLREEEGKHKIKRTAQQFWLPNQEQDTAPNNEKCAIPSSDAQPRGRTIQRTRGLIGRRVLAAQIQEWSGCSYKSTPSGVPWKWGWTGSKWSPEKDSQGEQGWCFREIREQIQREQMNEEAKQRLSDPLNFKFLDMEQFQTLLKPTWLPAARFTEVEHPQVRVGSKEVKELDSWPGKGPFRCSLQ